MIAGLTAVKSRVGTPLNSWILRSTAYGVLSMYIGTEYSVRNRVVAGARSAGPDGSEYQRLGRSRLALNFALLDSLMSTLSRITG